MFSTLTSPFSDFLLFLLVLSLILLLSFVIHALQYWLRPPIHLLSFSFLRHCYSSSFLHHSSITLYSLTFLLCLHPSPFFLHSVLPHFPSLPSPITYSTFPCLCVPPFTFLTSSFSPCPSITALLHITNSCSNMIPGQVGFPEGLALM